MGLFFSMDILVCILSILPEWASLLSPPCVRCGIDESGVNKKAFASIDNMSDNQVIEM